MNIAPFMQKRYSPLYRALRSVKHALLRFLGNHPDTLYIWYPEYNCLFVAVPKNANSTVNFSLLKKLGLYRPDLTPEMLRTLLSARSISAHEACRLPKDAFVFGFARNPLTRLVSCYHDKIERGHHPMHDIYFGILYPGMPFEQFVRRVCAIPDWLADPHFRSQTSMFFAKGLVPDFLGRVEHFDCSFRPIRERFELPTMRPVNQTRRSSDLATYYTPALLKMVHRRYMLDFKRFGYEVEYRELLEQLESAKHGVCAP